MKINFISLQLTSLSQYILIRATAGRDIHCWRNQVDCRQEADFPIDLRAMTGGE